MFKKESGQGLVEYALIMVLVAVVVIVILALLPIPAIVLFLSAIDWMMVAIFALIFFWVIWVGVFIVERWMPPSATRKDGSKEDGQPRDTQ